eukprot:4904496-Lingulodinium_polyedra.AAC.1
MCIRDSGCSTRCRDLVEEGLTSSRQRAASPVGVNTADGQGLNVGQGQASAWPRPLVPEHGRDD